MQKKTRVGLIALVAVLAVGGGGYYAIAKKSSASTAAQYIVGDVKYADVTKAVSATGTVQNNTLVNLSFGTAGRLTSLKAKAGQAVKKGDVLAELDKTTLQNSVESAAASLRSAQAKLTAAQQGVSEADLLPLQASISKAQADVDTAKRNLVTAQNNLATAQSNLDTAKQKASNAYLAQQVSDASAKLSQAQSQYDTVSKSGDVVQTSMAKAQLDLANKNYSAAISAQADTTAAQASVDSAQTSVNTAQTQVQNADNSVHTAQASYDSAVAQLEAKKQPPSATDIETAQASVQQAQTQLATAQNNLVQATMTAPFDGVIASVTPHEGEQVGGNATVLTLQASGATALQITIPIDEADIPLIKLGQKATVMADGMPGKRLQAVVDTIAPNGVTQSNVTTFPVTLRFTAEPGDLKVGQSVTVNILIEQKTHVLTVPSEAVRGLGNRHSVSLYKGDTTQPEQKQVETGLDDGMNTEIKNGVSEGDKVVLGTKSTTTSSNQKNQNQNQNGQNNMLGGGNRRGGAGNLGGFSGGGGGGKGN